ncbi:hypothetical protein HMPREF1250_0023 [Megasphaera vaginalis (ex Srinivasan et al. 2021)]|uniref:Uncharacterized protein n=1 Tax=Megasphaera vaginalis (ex Srinivasan et al. 2021) TaxID=1111454 RepID=U7UHZ2_9FIRM|nr:hypothetical protein HMPREF1250_0023 [Megasphaera vaginalis (ex Srinivasan et al. 2021)]
MNGVKLLTTMHTDNCRKNHRYGGKSLRVHCNSDDLPSLRGK